MNKLENVKQLNIGKLFLATFIPSGIAFGGFHLLLPKLVKLGVSVLAGYSVVASSMLTIFLTVTILLVKRESGILGIKIRERLCLKRLTLKKSLISMILIVIIMGMTLLAAPVTRWLIDIFNIEIPGYLPFFLNPAIDPGTADVMVLSSGISLIGRWDILILLSITLILNILTEEFYFRGWMLPKLAGFGKWAWVLNGLFFALYHTYQLWLFPTILVASLGFAYLNYRMRSILPSLIAHLLINTLSVLSLVSLFING